MAEQARARDPVKVSLAIGGSLAAALAIAGSVLSVSAGQKRAELQTRQQRYDEVNRSLQTALGADFGTIKAQAEDIIAMNQARTLCAPQLALLKDLVPDKVQLSRITFSVAMSAPDPVTTQPAEDPSQAKAKRTARPKTGSHLVVQLEGKVYSGRPEIDVDDFIQTLRSDPAFSGQVKQIQLRTIARASVSSEGGVGAAQAAFFVIECQYKERS